VGRCCSVFDDPEETGDRKIRAQLDENDQRLRSFVEVSFLLVAVGVLSLFVLPRFPVHGVRRLGGGALLGFGGWLDFAAHREWKENSVAIAQDRTPWIGLLPRRAHAGLLAAAGLAALALLAGHRR
jgi:hypothetical protein